MNVLIVKTLFPIFVPFVPVIPYSVFYRVCQRNEKRNEGGMFFSFRDRSIAFALIFEGYGTIGMNGTIFRKRFTERLSKREKGSNGYKRGGCLQASKPDGKGLPKNGTPEIMKAALLDGS